LACIINAYYLFKDMVPFVNRLLDIDVCFDTNVNIPTMYKVRMPTMKLLP